MVRAVLGKGQIQVFQEIGRCQTWYLGPGQQVEDEWSLRNLFRGGDKHEVQGLQQWQAVMENKIRKEILNAFIFGRLMGTKKTKFLKRPN